MTKQPKDNIGDDAQESLVQALESIKGLLEKSETKLAAARESIALANESSKKSKFHRKDEDIPVLSDIVVPDTARQEPAVEAEAVIETTAPLPQGIVCQDVIDLIDEFQQRMQPLLSETITNSSILKLEDVLNKALKKELHQLRNEVKQLDV